MTLFIGDEIFFTHKYNISESRTGIQSCLDNLQVESQKWKLTVNNKKAKVMVVGKIQSFAQLHCFSFKKEPLEICWLYPYLRTIINNRKSARRAMYTLLGSTNKFASRICTFFISKFVPSDFLTKRQLKKSR